jgi:hypothetical protein
MRRLGLELTDRCNLACRHCLRRINHHRRDLDTALAEAALAEAARLGFEAAVFTGGEPTLHRDFVRLVRAATAAGLGLTVVTNGQRPQPLWEALQDAGVRENLVVALSLEAATPERFDAVRGAGAYRRFVTACAGLVARRARIRLNATLGPWNRGELPAIATLAYQLGAEGLTVASYQPAGDLAGAADLPALAALHAEIEAAAALAPLPVRLGYEPITRRATHLCATLALDDLNVDHLGRVTFCCQLSTLRHAVAADTVVVAALSEGVGAAVAAQARQVAGFLENKLHAWRDGPPEPLDAHPCAYCVRSFSRAMQGAQRRAA